MGEDESAIVVFLVGWLCNFICILNRANKDVGLGNQVGNSLDAFNRAPYP
jgi:hypothetical protein